MKPQTKTRHPEKGFTLIETMVSIVVLSLGILSLGAVFAQGIFYSNITQFDYIAQKKAEQAVEAVFMARDTKMVTWAQIRNVVGASGADGGVFLDGPQPLLAAGPDGLVGTADDDPLTPDVVVIGPGADRKMGTADDEVFKLSGTMTREIQIRDIVNDPNLRQITIIIKYKVGRLQRTYQLITYVSAFA